MVVLNGYLYVSMKPEQVSARSPRASAAKSWSNILMFSCSDIITTKSSVALVHHKEFPRVVGLTTLMAKNGFLFARVESFPFWLYEKLEVASAFPALVVLSPELDVMSFYGGEDLPFGLVFER